MVQACSTSTSGFADLKSFFIIPVWQLKPVLVRNFHSLHEGKNRCIATTNYLIVLHFSPIPIAMVPSTPSLY